MKWSVQMIWRVLCWPMGLIRKIQKDIEYWDEVEADLTSAAYREGRERRSMKDEQLRLQVELLRRQTRAEA